MKGFIQRRRWAGLLMGAAMAMVLAGAGIAARAEESDPSPAMMAPEAADPELAQIARDIILLRMINQAGLTPDQIAAVIPVLEGVLSDERAMREEVKRLMLEQRSALLRGDVPDAQLEASRRKIKDRTQAFMERVRQRVEGLGKTLNPDQMKGLRALVTTGPSLWRRGGMAPEQGREGSRREPPGMQRNRERGGVTAPRWGEESGPSVRILARVIALLKEKLAVMRPKG
jgi:hypothetical protein